MEINIPLLISAEQGFLQPCQNPESESCGFWASGLMRVSKSPERGSFSAITILTMAGCTICDKPHVRQQDIDVIGRSSGRLDEYGDAIIETDPAQSLATRAMDFISE